MNLKWFYEGKYLCHINLLYINFNVYMKNIYAPFFPQNIGILNYMNNAFFHYDISCRDGMLCIYIKMSYI